MARSPIEAAAPQVVVAGWLVSGRRSEAELTLTDLAPLTKLSVRSHPVGPLAQALATEVGRASRRGVEGLTGDVLVTCAAPGEWLILAEPGAQGHLVGWTLTEPSDQLVTVVDITHGRALLRLAGAHAQDVLAKECAVDLTDRGHGLGQRALRTAVAGLAVDIVCEDVVGERSYLLHCERSSGQYLVDVVLDAGSEFAVDIDGFRLPGLFGRPSA